MKKKMTTSSARVFWSRLLPRCVYGFIDGESEEKLGELAEAFQSKPDVHLVLDLQFRRRTLTTVTARVEEDNPAAVALGALGGKQRAKNLTAAERKAIARQGAAKRWGSRRKEK